MVHGWDTQRAASLEEIWTEDTLHVTDVQRARVKEEDR